MKYPCTIYAPTGMIKPHGYYICFWNEL